MIAKLQVWGLALLGLLLSLAGAFGYGRYKGGQKADREVAQAQVEQRAAEKTADQVARAAESARRVEQQVEGMKLDESRKTLLDRWARD